MDLNQLLFHHQIAVMRGHPGEAPSRGSRFDIVAHYERRIARLRRETGTTPYPDWSR
ncbi:hypothetical protein ACLIMP_23230 [Novosphingobium aerophilum]|uniref:hypothetical protein n=1 Tax=Novosphingobium TaxID=165696 RepID=UPI0010CE2F50|nr:MULTISPECIES: hypothetical protein [unclassified Novosphingobium]TCM33701.1 hypothetical protein EDF59_11916 [Novosphingobium sp. ST904]WRT95140.1 hypothetical protein U9J33_23370 [Novosphingobium sp. RL4]